MYNRRIAIKRILEEEFTVYHSGEIEGNAHLNFPFVILELTGERQPMRSHFRTFSVFLYVSIKAPVILDSCEKRVKKLLHNKRIEVGTRAFLAECTGSSAEFVNEKMKALGKVIEFKIPLVL